jgi:ribonuclease I
MSLFGPKRHFAAPQQQRRFRSKADSGIVGRVVATVQHQHLAPRSGPGHNVGRLQVRALILSYPNSALALKGGRYSRHAACTFSQKGEDYFGATILVRSDISPSNEITMSSPGCR